MRLSVESAPSLDTAWSQLAATRAAFLKSNPLSSSWFRFTEVTLNHGRWNFHDNLVVFGSRVELAELKKEILPRWVSAAARAGTLAHEVGLYAKFARSIAAVVQYAPKGLMRPAKTPDNGMTPADLLIQYIAGDAEAAKHWHHLETFAYGTLDAKGKLLRRRWTATQDAARKKKRPRAAIYRRTRGRVFTLDQVEAGQGVSAVMATLGCSRATAYNLLKRAAA